MHRIGHATQEAFEGDGAERYDRRGRWLRGLTGRTAGHVAAIAPPGGHVLDVGCGPGRLLEAIAARRPDVSVTGVDLSAAMVELAGARLAAVSAGGAALGAAGAPGQARVLVGDVAALPVPDESVDVVTATLTAHHWSEPQRGFAELARVLRPGGSALVVEMRGPSRGLADAMADAFGTVDRGTAWVLGLPLLVRLSARTGATSPVRRP